MGKKITVVVDGIIFQTKNNGGIARMCAEIINNVNALNQDIVFKIFSTGSVKQQFPNGEMIKRFDFCKNQISIPNKLRKWLLPICKNLSILTNFGIGLNQIWHSTYYSTPKFWLGKKIVTVADLIYENYNYMFDSPEDDELRKQKRNAIMSANAIICISETTRYDLLNYYKVNPNKVITIPLGVSETFKIIESEMFQKPQIGTRNSFLLYVGKRNLYKNFSTLLSAFNIWRYRRNVALVIVGEPLDDSETNLISNLDINGAVFVLSHVSDEHLCQLYNQTIALVYPSIYEGFGLPLLEAMACGCPIIASDIPSTKEIAKNYPLYFPASDISMLVRTLDLAFESQITLDKIQYGLEIVKEYSWAKSAENTTKLYNMVSKKTFSEANSYIQ